MKLLEILRKLGILRYGAAAGTYSSTKDAPEGLVGDEFFDSRKSLNDRDEKVQPE